MNDKQIEKLENLVSVTMQNLGKIQEVLDHMKDEERRSMYRSMPGVEGTYDGSYLVAEDNTKIEVPANYAAKSRLVFGDTLKMIEENGKTLFKQLQKVPRKEVNGVVTKKEGKWYVLTESGSHKILDVAADFNKLEVNDQISVLLPENNLSAPFAALEKVLTQKELKVAEVAVTEGEKKVKPVEEHKPPYKRPVERAGGGRRGTRDFHGGRGGERTERKPRESVAATGARVNAPRSVTPKPSDSGDQNIKKEFVMDLASDKDRKPETSQTPKRAVLEEDDLR